MWYPEALATHEEVIQDRDLFQRTLNTLLQLTNVKLKIPKVNNAEVDLHLLYKEVTTLGGVELVIARKQWVVVCEPFNFPASFTNKSFVIKKLYTSTLQCYEDVYFHRRTGPMASPLMGSCPEGVSSGEARAKRKAEYQSESGLGGPVTVVPISAHPMPGRSSSSGSLSAPSTIEAGTHFSGIIDCQFDQGYMITINLPNQKLHGVLYKQAPLNLAHMSPAHVNRAREDTAISQELESGLDLGKRLKLDPNHPRPSRTPFQFFQLGVNKEQLLQLHPDPTAANPRELLPKLMSDLWHQMTPEQRRPFEAMGEKDRERYEKEFVELARKSPPKPEASPPRLPETRAPFPFEQQLLPTCLGSALHTPPLASRRPPHPTTRHIRIGIPIKPQQRALSHLGMPYPPSSHQTYPSASLPTHHGQLMQHSMPPPQPMPSSSRLLSAPGYALVPPDMEPEDLEHLCFYPDDHQGLQQDFHLDQALHDDHDQLLQGMPDNDDARLGPSMAHGMGPEDDAFQMSMAALQDHQDHHEAAAAAAAAAVVTRAPNDIDIFGCSTTIKVNNNNPSPKADAMVLAAPASDAQKQQQQQQQQQQDHHHHHHHHHHHQQAQLPCLSGQDVASGAGSPSETVSHAFNRELAKQHHMEPAGGHEPHHYDRGQAGQMLEQEQDLSLPHMFD